MFGENLTLKNLDESDVFFGNQYRLGEAILEVSEIKRTLLENSNKVRYKRLGLKECLLVEKQASIFECYKKDM